MSKPKYDSTVARIAGNILSGRFTVENLNDIGCHGLKASQESAVGGAVIIARAIVAEVKRTEPAADEGSPTA